MSVLFLSICETVCSLFTLQFLLVAGFQPTLSILASSESSYLYCSKTSVMAYFQSQESLEQLFVSESFRDEQHVANEGFQM